MSEITKKELVKLFSEGTSLSGMDLTGVNRSRTVLSGGDMTGADLRR